MSKPWSEKPLWWKCYMSVHKSVYMHAGHIIGHLGCNGFAFYDAAKKLPDYNQLHYENAVRDLTVFTKREQGQYELTEHAKKVLRIVIGPAPTDPVYAEWWRTRMISVRQMQADGQAVEFAEAPQVPLEPTKEETPKKSRKKKAG